MSENPTPGGRYPHVLRTVLETPWAIEASTLHAIREFIATSATHFADTDIEARAGASYARRGETGSSVRILPLHGVITPKSDLMTEMFGGTSVERFRGAFLEAVQDKDVSAIILDVASPGGMTDMISELATDIRQARGKKPIVAVANTKAASAAYWIASQADEVIVTPSGSVGSVGAFAAHDDLSGAMEKAGIKTTLVSAGKFKTEANPYEPLSDEARAMIQERVDDAYNMFTGDVAKGRRVPVDTVRSGYGEGRMVSAKQAVKLGMADSIGTLQQTVERFTNPQAAASGVEAGTFADNIVASYSQPNVYPGSFVEQTDALHDSAVALLERLTSLAEVETGRLTKAKRQSLAACSGAIREVANTVDGVLRDTDPHKSRAVLDGLLLADIARRHLTT